MRKGRVREILESMIWNSRYESKAYRIVFIDRGMPNNTNEVRGNEVIVRSDRIILGDGREIPHHRIIEIWRGGELLYSKRDRLRTKNPK